MIGFLNKWQMWLKENKVRGTITLVLYGSLLSLLLLKFNFLSGFLVPPAVIITLVWLWLSKD